MNNQALTVKEEQEIALVEAVNKCHLASSMKNDTIKSLKLAAGVDQLKKVLLQPEIQNLIMGFQNNAIGFLTDRKASGYPANIVINSVIEALGAGAYLHGNEFNIIASRCYFAQSFFVRKVREYCTEHKIKRHFSYTSKKTGNEGKQFRWEVKATIVWKLPKEEEKQTTNETYNLVGMSEDQVIGKAVKRAHQWLYNELTNNNFVCVPDDSFDFDMPLEKPSFTDPEKGTDALKDKLTAKAGEK